MSNNLPIYIVSIMKNEEAHIERWFNSFKDELRPGDGAFLLDTGSTDSSYKLAKKLGINTFKKTYKDWSFAVARNDLREMLPDQDAWVLSLDLDEVLSPNWRECLDKVPMEVNRPRYNYFWNWKSKVLNDDGTPNIPATIAKNDYGLTYQGDKIVRRHSHKWVNRVHEVNTPVQDEVQGFTDLKIYHFADDSKSRGQYLPLLLLDVEENPENDRNCYYAARELMYYGRAEESVKMFKHHLGLKSAVWAPERAFSMRYIAQQLPAEREHWLLRGCAEYPWGRELWVELAKHYHDTENWAGCFAAAARALSITDRGALYLTESVMWEWLPHDLMALSAAKLGKYNLALEHGLKALHFAPDDSRLSNNVFWYKYHTSKVDVVIPTKSNIDGLTLLVSQLKCDYKVDRIVVVADGEDAYNMLSALPNDVIKLCMPASVGNIHKMWNLGLQILGTKNHIAFINDDISLEPNCMTNLLTSMLQDPSIGLICPNYAKEPSINDTRDYDVFGVSGSRYDGWGGMAGFCFMIAKDLLPTFKFNEDLKWLAGDNLITHWVTSVMKRRAVVTHKARCQHEDSKTFNTDPPEDWLRQIHRDKLVYEKLMKSYEEAIDYDEE